MRASGPLERVVRCIWSNHRSYSITWSARCRSDGGIVRPRALAVLRLMTSSNFVGCSTGRSAGLGALEDLVHVGRGAPLEVGQFGSIGHQDRPASTASRKANMRRQPVLGRELRDESSIDDMPMDSPETKSASARGRLNSVKAPLGVLLGGCSFGQRQGYAQGLRPPPARFFPWAPQSFSLAAEVSDPRDVGQQLFQELQALGLELRPRQGS